MWRRRAVFGAAQQRPRINRIIHRALDPHVRLAPNAVVHDPVSTDLPVALSIETTPAAAGVKLADRRLVAPVRHNPAVVGQRSRY